jgi:putative membrane protein
VPPLSILLGAWRFDWAAVALVASAACLYALCLRQAARKGTRWPVWRILAFYLLGLGSMVLLTCGFPGVLGEQLRWAYALKASLLLFVVPLLLGLGRPLSLARAALKLTGQERLNAILANRMVRFFSNSLVAPLLALALFSSFLTPAFATLRSVPVADAALTVAVPLLGLLMALPIIEEENFQRSSAFITLELLYVFIELLVDAVPGILLRLNGEVLDHVLSAPSPQEWFPSPLRDQQLAGDLLWFICEAVDLPLIIFMFMRFSRRDKREARSFDELSDEEIEALNEQHLRR